MKKIIYGMAKFKDRNYGYGSEIKKNKIDTHKIINYLNKKKLVQAIEVSKRYKGSVNSSVLFKSKKIHYKVDKIPKKKNLIQNFLNNEINKYLTLKKNIEILYLHQNELNIISNPFILKSLKKIKKKKKIKYIGVSVYTLKELEYALKSKIISVIQIPLNIADSYLYSKIPSNCKKIIVARSIFLQGALLNNIKKHPYKDEIENYIKQIKKFCKKNNLNYFKLVVSFPFNCNKIKYVIISSIFKANIDRIFKSIIKIDKSKIKMLNLKSKDYKDWKNPKNWK